MLSLLATHILSIKRALLDASFEKAKPTFSASSNSAFFLSLPDSQHCSIEDSMTPFAHRQLTLHPINLLNVCTIIAECRGMPAEAAAKVVGVCQLMKDCF